MTAVGSNQYVIKVAEHFDDHWASWLGGWDIDRHEDGSTTLTGDVADQAQLHGLLAGLRDIGATLLSITGAPDAKPKGSLLWGASAE